jgi:glycerol-3-phosphate dehydrogenase
VGVSRTVKATFDLAVIGGGINGAGIAREAAGRGASVVLCEQDDLASGTSSASTKLIHGGLRYLEHGAFRLVRESLREREVLWSMAPHLIEPRRFVLPHHAGLRPAWILRLGLFLYDHLGGRERLPGTAVIDLATDVAGRPLRPSYRRGFEYSDCSVDDARLVVLTALDAAERGAVIRTHCRCVAATREDNVWRITVEDAHTGARDVLTASALVNAAGPWVGRVLSDTIHAEAPAAIRLVKGAHIVVRRLYEHDRCYIFQNRDGRIVFAIPFEDDFTLIGTTDVDYRGDPAAVTATADEIAYLCGIASEYFARPITPGEVLWSFAGVRSLYDDGSANPDAVTRDYVLAVDADARAPPLLTVIGGKITTFRRLAAAAVDRLSGYLPPAKPWTSTAPLPGGDFAPDGLPALIEALRADYPFLAPPHARRLARAYGTRAFRLLDGCDRAADLGRCFGGDLFEREVDYVMAHEWAQTAVDVVWRRSKLGLRMSAPEIAALDAWMAARRNAGRAALGLPAGR